MIMLSIQIERRRLFMYVGELIEILKGHDPTAEVIISVDFEDASVDRVYRNKDGAVVIED